MAQKLRVEYAAEISLAAVLKVAPRNWTFGPNPHGTLRVGDPSHPLCFVARDIEPSTVAVTGVKKAQPVPPQYLDARQLRDEFLSLREEGEVLEFLNRVGAFSRLDKAERGRGWNIDDIHVFQGALTMLAVAPPTKWVPCWQDFSSAEFVSLGVKEAFGFTADHNVRFHWHNDPQLAWLRSGYVAVIEERNALSAILASIEIDHLRGATFRLCALRDCRKLYEITSEHGRKYCGYSCAHLASVRRTRKRQKQKAPKSGSASRKRPDGK